MKNPTTINPNSMKYIASFLSGSGAIMVTVTDGVGDGKRRMEGWMREKGINGFGV